jgi:hypothetical protein
MTAIEDISTRISALDKIITSAAAFPMHPSLADVRSPMVDALVPGPSPVVRCPSPPPPSTSPRTEPRTDGSSCMPVLPTWGHGFHPSAPWPLLSTFRDPSLRVDTAPTDVPGGKIKTPQSIDPVWHARNKNMNRFDSAGLADLGYHIGDFGVDSLTEAIISKCGYQSFHVDHPEDVFLCFQEIVNIHRVVVQTAKVDWWRVNLRGAWLIKVGSTQISTISNAQSAFWSLYETGAPSVMLLFSHPELRRDISNKGLPIVSSAPFLQQTHDQLNRRWDFSKVAEYLRKAPPYKIIDSSDVLNYVTCVMQLTRGKLLRHDDWCNWQALEFLQLDQYNAQSMFGLPLAVESNKAVFNLVWSYGI